MIRLPASSPGEPSSSPGSPPAPSPYAVLATTTTPRILLASRSRAWIGSFHATIPGALNGESSLIERFAP
jgi:hypothetical protein